MPTVSIRKFLFTPCVYAFRASAMRLNKIMSLLLRVICLTEKNILNGMLWQISITGSSLFV